MYKVIVKFADLQDNKHLYRVGDIFPREGVTVSKERISELSGNKNNLRRPLIEEIADKPVPAKKPEEKPVEVVPEETSEDKPKKTTESKSKKGKKKSDTD